MLLDDLSDSASGALLLNGICKMLSFGISGSLGRSLLHHECSLRPEAGPGHLGITWDCRAREAEALHRPGSVESVRGGMLAKTVAG